jgi:hypothetical protein
MGAQADGKGVLRFGPLAETRFILKIRNESLEDVTRVEIF